MSKRSVVFSLVAVAVMVVAAMAWAAAQSKSYQVTGPVLELTDTKIVVQKGDEKWDIERDKDSKVTGDLKVGAKVTIEYRMYATTVTVKGGKEAAKAQ